MFVGSRFRMPSNIACASSNFFSASAISPRFIDAGVKSGLSASALVKCVRAPSTSPLRKLMAPMRFSARGSAADPLREDRDFVRVSQEEVGVAVELDPERQEDGKGRQKSE